MAKAASVLIKLKSSESGFFFVKSKNSRNKEKLELMKYDPVVRKHVLFKETKMK